MYGNITMTTLCILYTIKKEKNKGKPIKINRKLTRCQWLTPIILATWEAEIRREGPRFKASPGK
jgi:hypothetical protein